MLTMDQRQALAERATEIFNSDEATTYSQAIDIALAEQNPTADPGGAEKLIQALLNVKPEPPRPARHRNWTTDPQE